ncbi:short chain isoprenyl diphosphate synthase IdsA [Methanobrevibacter filiformis]|uniref:Octaprenyl-diphosphate synthase n=1 Tax=Methanobrevibacter filiformis TaxID=55758 RepID=A0A166E8H4_9EURY|nr:short chain isoprenyl diphosphate synthase IdsA [Methanobrevibacter filiformis]KZX16389.1 octaprenyl-diphosphate synthase [Methanobrevibacter filiformis]
MQDIKEVLEMYSNSIYSEIKSALSTISPDELKEASIHLTDAGGKMLRPTLTILSCKAVGGDESDAIKSAAAIELIHTFSLIHDDIMDKDDIRRGKPAVHKVWGEPVAILAGDTLFSKAFQLVINAKSDVGSSQYANDTLATVADACVKICEGQAWDMGFEGNFEVKEEEYLDMIFKKTAALLATATKAGAIMGKGSEEEIAMMYDYGRFIGLAFQIRDDYLDLVSDEESLGKPVGSDIVEGKMTLIVVNALEKASADDKNKLIAILENDNSSPSDVDTALNIFEKYGSLEYSNNLAKEYVNNAKELLDLLPDSDYKNALKLIADYVLDRKK